MSKTFIESFRKVIAMVDSQANSLMSKDMPPTLKILADWSRKACDELATEIEKNRWIPVEERLSLKELIGTKIQVANSRTKETFTWYWTNSLGQIAGLKANHTHWRPITQPKGE